jgi:hypothetical protein
VKTVCSRSPIRSAARLVRAAVAFWLFQESTRGGYPLDRWLSDHRGQFQMNL